MKDIPLYSTFNDITPITKGMSGDKKFAVTTKDGKRLLLRIADIDELSRKKSEYALIGKLSPHIPMPKPVDFGVCGEGVYTLLTWVDGEEADKAVPKMSAGEQYRVGREAGSILRRVHELAPAETVRTWRERYFAVIDERLEAFRNEGERFDGWEIMLKYIEDNIGLLDGRPQTYHHGDYHMGNLILREGRVFVIDWHTVDFDNIGDPWYEFNRVSAEYPCFASGQVDGYFEGNVPDEFWRLLVYYLSVSAITSVVWTKYFAPDRLQMVLGFNISILKWFENMKNPVPKWYVKM